MGKIKVLLQRWGKICIIGIFLILAFAAGNTSGFSNKKVQVLGATTHVVPSPTATPAPTSVPVTIINNIIVPTQTPVLLTPSPTPTPVVIVITPTPTAQPTQEITPAPTVSPTPTQTVTVAIDYAGEHTTSTYTASVTAGETAWQVIQNAVGSANLHYTDYGGSLGIFITGFNGIDASANQYFDFQVNGTSASVGVSSYAVVDGDQLKFVLTNF